MDCLELKSLFETSVRCLAISMQDSMKKQLMLLDDCDFAMNDHIVESKPVPALDEGSDVKDCLEGLKETTEKYDISLEWGDACSLPLNYLTAWFENKYWK